MKKLLTTMWIIAVILSAFFGFNLRYTNEQNNKSVLIFSDFDELTMLENTLELSKEDILNQKKASGMAYVLVDIANLNENNEIITKINITPILKLKSGDNIEEFEKAIKEFSIKYISFDGDEVIGYPGNLDDVARIINQNHLIFTVYEKINQIGIQDQKGLDNLITKTDYAINRAYRLHKKQLASIDGNELFYKLLRGVLDRNIRFVEINQLENPSYTIQENYKQTNEGVETFVEFIEKMGYKVNEDVVGLSSNKLNENFYFLVMLGMALTFTVYIKRLIKPNKINLICVYIVTVVLLGYSNQILRINIEQSLALLASILYSSLASFMVMEIANRDTKRALTKSIMTFFGVNLLGGYVIVSCLNSLDYTMNLNMFRGVKVAFILPLIFYVVNYIIVYKVKLKDIKEYIKSKSAISIIVSVVIMAFVFALYILRSGNFAILKASRLELKIREALEYGMGIRPRTKEFLIGYPMLMLFVYYRKNSNKILKFILGLGMTVGGVSIINSFCHVFTNIVVSITRSVNGLILGVIVGSIAIKLSKNTDIRIALANNKLVKRLINLYNNKDETKI